ncbi:MAG: RIP metalloprotease RseP [Rubrivivax sp.]|nr:RIP metalloprotease RseP [Rubrivivax sp.]
MTTLLAFLLTLGVLIVVHEYGHYRVAVAFGVKVLRFSVGFGPVLWRRQRSPGSTEFVLCALPLGGYVRMLDERESPVASQELPHAFNRQPLLHRAAIVAAGPLANLALAIALYASAHWIGLDEPKAVLGPPTAGTPADRAGLRAGDWVRAIAFEGNEWSDVRSMSDLRWQLTQAALQQRNVQLQLSDREGKGSRTQTLDLSGFDSRDVDSNFIKKLGLAGAFGEPVLGEIKAAGPAAKAGLLAGDRITAVDGVPVGDAQTLRERIRSGVQQVNGQAQGQAQGQVQRWRVERDGRSLELEVTPRVARDGNAVVGRIDAFVGQPPAMVTVRHGFFEGIAQGAVRTWEVSSLTVRMLGRMLIGEASLKNLSGPITIADYAGQSVQQGLAYYLGFLALVSVSLGVLNLLPLPMLDGGHLMYYIFEGVTGRPVSDAWLARLQRGGIVVLLAMMSVALFNDVARLLGLH